MGNAVQDQAAVTLPLQQGFSKHIDKPLRLPYVAPSGLQRSYQVLLVAISAPALLKIEISLH